MQIKSNVHTHSTWCDGENTTRQMARAAIELGFTDLGFSSHSPTAFDKTCPGIGDETGYRREIALLKEEYAGRLGILCGVELDRYAPVDRAQYDYVIGSNHYLPPVDGRYLAVDNTLELLQREIADRYAGHAMAMVGDYYRSVVAMAEEQKPDIVGHFDLVTKYNRGGIMFDEELPAYRQAALEALDAVIDTIGGYGGMLELNTGAFARGLRDVPYPAPFLLRHAAQRKANMIITGDSHSTRALNAGFDVAVELLAQAGFTRIMALQGGRFVPLPLA